jgi:polar amino acid transport system ATP-binding protein
VSIAPLVEISNVRKSFGDTVVLDNVSLTVHEGQVMCLLGRSGSGKTTLLRCINHLETMDAGTITVAGNLVGYRWHGRNLREVKGRALAQSRRDIGFVFQQFNLFPHMTVLQNVMESPVGVKREPKAAARAYAMELLQRMGLAEKIDQYPRRLSGGQQQRVAIARALAMRPKLMLFDEPTSSLDPELVGEVLEAMRGLANEGMTMIVVTHELAFARQIADVVAFMNQGVIAEVGTPKEIFGNPRHPALQSFVS